MKLRIPPRAGGRTGRTDVPRRGARAARRAGRALRGVLPSWRLACGVAGGVVVALIGAFLVLYASVDIPDANAVARRQASVYYWADGTPMVSVGAVDRQSVTLDQVAPSLPKAVIAAENADFYQDSGVSLSGMARAALTIATGGDTQGGSTITQQYVKNTYLTQQQTVTRKVKELFISLKLGRSRSKGEILQGYLNTSWFGRDAYGVQAASYAYYGIPARELNPGQSAVLAALLKGAEQYDPAGGAANHKRAVDRWKWILDREVATGAMSAKERATYRVYPAPKPPAKPNSQAGQIGYLIDVANKYLRSRGGPTPQQLALGGYHVYTTFEKDKVRQLAGAVEAVRAKTLDPQKRAADRDVEAGAASVRTSDGAIVAVYGGADAVAHFSDNADTSGVPAGSLFKPFVYAAALTAAGVHGGSPATPGGAGSARPAGMPSLSETAPFETMADAIGLGRVRDLAVKTGLREESMAKLEPTFAIGTSTPSAVRLAGAYATFAEAGRSPEPYSVTRVTDEGRAVPGFGAPAPHRSMPSAVADQVALALRKAGASALDSPQWDNKVLGAATGSSDFMKSAWFVGATRHLSTAVTLFRTTAQKPDLLSMQGVGGPGTVRGSTLPPRIWAAYAAQADPAATAGTLPRVLAPDKAVRPGGAVRPQALGTVS